MTRDIFSVFQPITNKYCLVSVIYMMNNPHCYLFFCRILFLCLLWIICAHVRIHIKTSVCCKNFYWYLHQLKCIKATTCTDSYSGNEPQRSYLFTIVQHSFPVSSWLANCIDMFWQVDSWSRRETMAWNCKWVVFQFSYGLEEGKRKRQGHESVQ